jgi:hypothetical protein
LTYNATEFTARSPWNLSLREYDQTSATARDLQSSITTKAYQAEVGFMAQHENKPDLAIQHFLTTSKPSGHPAA